MSVVIDCSGLHAICLSTYACLSCFSSVFLHPFFLISVLKPVLLIFLNTGIKIVRMVHVL